MYVHNQELFGQRALERADVSERQARGWTLALVEPTDHGRDFDAASEASGAKEP